MKPFLRETSASASFSKFDPLHKFSKFYHLLVAYIDTDAGSVVVIGFDVDVVVVVISDVAIFVVTVVVVTVDVVTVVVVTVVVVTVVVTVVVYAVDLQNKLRSLVW